MSTTKFNPPTDKALSVVIITCNEENNIIRCIEHAKHVSNDIVVVDSGSNDKTVSLAEQAGARVFFRPWNGYSEQKNFGNQQTQNDIVLSLDADEVLSDELAVSIKKALKNYQPNTMLELNVLSKFENKFIYHGGWYPDWHPRIFEKKNVSWGNHAKVHESLQAAIPVRKIRLKGDLLHYTAPERKKYREKLKNYALLFAYDRFEKRIRHSPSKKYISSGFRFIKDYFFRMGFLDGKAGWNVIAENAVYTFLKYKYLENLYKLSLVGQKQLSID